MKIYVTYFVYKIFNLFKNFKFQGKCYRYFTHQYNLTWRTERAVEIPIIWNLVKKNQDKRILEVGNVLSYYFPVKHDILDKYEKGEGVINRDVVDFKPKRKYDLIVSISTLEHIGWDEKPRNPMKILKAIKNLMSLLAPKGKIMVTLPLGYNSEMDKLLRKGEIKFTKQYNLKRVSGLTNRWKEVGWKEIRNAKYFSPYRNANGVIVGIIRNK